MNSYLNAWKQILDFTGKTSRKDYWLFFLFHIIVCWILGMVSGLVENIYLLVVALPMYSITCRRLNDVNKSHLWCVPGCLWYLMAALWFIVPTTFKFLLGVLIGILSAIAIIPTIVLLVYTLRASESK